MNRESAIRAGAAVLVAGSVLSGTSLARADATPTDIMSVVPTNPFPGGPEIPTFPNLPTAIATVPTSTATPQPTSTATPSPTQSTPSPTAAATVQPASPTAQTTGAATPVGPKVGDSPVSGSSAFKSSPVVWAFISLAIAGAVTTASWLGRRLPSR